MIFRRVPAESMWPASNFKKKENPFIGKQAAGSHAACIRELFKNSIKILRISSFLREKSSTSAIAISTITWITLQSVYKGNAWICEEWQLSHIASSRKNFYDAIKFFICMIVLSEWVVRQPISIIKSAKWRWIAAIVIWIWRRTMKTMADYFHSSEGM